MNTTPCTDLIPISVEHEGATWPLWRQADGAEPLARDSDVAEWLGYERPRKIRELISRYSDELGVFSPHRGAKIASDGTMRGRPEEGYLLTEAQALFLAAKSETPKATQVLKAMIAVFLRARDTLAGWDPALLRAAEQRALRAEAELARLRRLSSPRIRPMDLASAWAKAHLEVAASPLPLKAIWPTYVEWMQRQGYPVPGGPVPLSLGIRQHFHQQQLEVLPSGYVRYAAAYYCAFRAEPLPVELPVQQQEELPFAAEPQPEPEELAERALKVLRQQPKTPLGAVHLAEVLGSTAERMALIMGALVEAGAAEALPRAGRTFYKATPERAAQVADVPTEVRERIREYAEAHDGEMLRTSDMLELVPGNAAARAKQLIIARVLRDLGYERHRTELARGWRPYVFSKPGQEN